MEKCLNCGKEFSGNFCNHCGQKNIKSKITMKIVLSDFIQNVFLFDSRFYKTFISILIKPGITVQDFLNGKRTKYLQPFQFFLLFMTIYLIVLGYFGESFFHYINSNLQLDSDKAVNFEFVQMLVRKNLNVFYFILTPVIAFYIHIYYRKSKYNFAEILIFSLYLMGIVFFLSSIIIVLGQLNEKFFALKTLVILGYLPYAVVQFSKSFSFGGIIKAVLTVISSYFTFSVIISIVIMLYAFIFLM